MFLRVGDLSGGEKARLSLLKLMLGGANTLLLDEPTNHMDIESKEVFEDALTDFPGTALIVSHDRYFLQKIPDRILELTPSGIVEYMGKYDYYMEKKSQVESGKKYLESMRQEESGAAPVSSEELRRKKKAEEAAIRRRVRHQRRHRGGDKPAGIQDIPYREQMCLPENISDYEYLERLGEELAEAKKQYEEKLEEWMNLEENS